MTPADAFEVAAAILASLGGGTAIVVGGSSWLGRLWAQRILEAERNRFAAELEALRSELQVQQRRLQSELDKAIHVHRMQFEAEYKSLTDVWAKLSTLRARMSVVRPTTEIAPADEDENARRQRLADRAGDFFEALGAFLQSLDSQSPFYPEDIFRALEAALAVARREEIELRLGPQHAQGGEWQRQGRANFEELKACCDRVSALIRDYLRQLRVTR